MAKKKEKTPLEIELDMKKEQVERLLTYYGYDLEECSVLKYRLLAKKKAWLDLRITAFLHERNKVDDVLLWNK